MRLPKERIIFDNYNVLSDEEVKEILLDEGYEEDEINDEAMWDRRRLEEEVNWDDARVELTHFFKDKTVLFMGELGLWHGVCAGGMLGEFWSVFNKAIKDCDYIKLYDENGHFYLTYSHHDGTNHFEVKILTSEGLKYYDKWCYSSGNRTTQDCHTQIFNRYSVLPKFVEKVYGCPAREYQEPTKEFIINKINNYARSNYAS